MIQIPAGHDNSAKARLARLTQVASRNFSRQIVRVPECDVTQRLTSRTFWDEVIGEAIRHGELAEVGPNLPYESTTRHVLALRMPEADRVEPGQAARLHSVEVTMDRGDFVVDVSLETHFFDSVAGEYAELPWLARLEELMEQEADKE